MCDDIDVYNDDGDLTMMLIPTTMMIIFDNWCREGAMGKLITVFFFNDNDNKFVDDMAHLTSLVIVMLIYTVGMWSDSTIWFLCIGASWYPPSLL